MKSALRRPEMGGIRGADSSGTVSEFCPDTTGSTMANQYTPDCATLNRVIAQWFQRGIYFAGFVHSHPKEYTALSCADVEYARKIKAVNHMESVLMLLYIPETNRFYEYLI